MDTSVSIKQEEIPEDSETLSPKGKKKDKKERKKKKEKQNTEGEESMVVEEDASGVIKIIIIRYIKNLSIILYIT